MKKAKILIFSLLLINPSLWAIDAQSLKEGALDLWDKSKAVADTVGESVQDTWDDSELLRENLGEKTKDGWNNAKVWSTQKYDELKQSKENRDNSNSWWNFSKSEKKSEENSAIRNSLKEIWDKAKDGSKQLGEKIQENTKSLL